MALGGVTALGLAALGAGCAQVDHLRLPRDAAADDRHSPLHNSLVTQLINEHQLLLPSPWLPPALLITLMNSWDTIFLLNLIMC